MSVDKTEKSLQITSKIFLWMRWVYVSQFNAFSVKLCKKIAVIFPTCQDFLPLIIQIFCKKPQLGVGGSQGFDVFYVSVEVFVTQLSSESVKIL